MNKYEEVGLRFGSPGTADKLPTIVNDDDYWVLRHVFLSLGALDTYIEKFGTDDELTAEKTALENLRDKLVPSVRMEGRDHFQNANSYYEVGKTHIKS